MRIRVGVVRTLAVRTLAVRVVAVLAVLVGSTGLADAAITLRYALVVGSNDSPSASLPRLKQAEKEAQRLARALVDYGRFEPDRVLTLVGPDGASVRSAVAELAVQRRRDEARYGPVRALFAFFYTGHGLRGQLTLKDGPLGRQALADIFTAFPADFRLGFFDACYSAGLPINSHQPKGGVLPLPGVSVVASLPEGLVQSRGSMWLMSSGPEEPSFEDRDVGGVFTHYFIEAMRRATRDGPGIRLDQVWQYTRRETLRHTSAHGIPQHPQMLADLQGEAFPYFSFPQPRSARLWLGPAIAGQLLLSYADGGLQERIIKPAGKALLVHVYPGRARLMRVEAGGLTKGQTLVLSKDIVRIQGDGASSEPPMGYRRQLLWQKGAEGALGVTAEVESPTQAWHLALSYGRGISGSGRLTLEDTVLLGARVDTGGVVIEAGLGYGHTAEDFQSWSYRLHGLRFMGQAGYGWDLGPTRLSLTGGLHADALFQSWSDESSHTAWSVTPMARVGLVVPAHARVKLGLDLYGGSTWSPGVEWASDQAWSPTLLMQLTMLVGL